MGTEDAVCMRRQTATQLLGRTVAHCYSAAVERELEQSFHKPDFPYILFKYKCLAFAAALMKKILFSTLKCVAGVEFLQYFKSKASRCIETLFLCLFKTFGINQLLLFFFK